MEQKLGKGIINWKNEEATLDAVRLLPRPTFSGHWRMITEY